MTFKKITEKPINNILTEAIQNLPDGLLIFDRNKKIVLVNAQAEKFLVMDKSDIVNKFLGDFSSHFILGPIINFLPEDFETIVSEKELSLDKPQQRVFSISILPLDEINRMIIIYDVSRDRIVNRMKTEFVLIAAHQLRTPLANLKWLLRLFLDGDVGKISEEQTKLLQRGYESLEAMIILISDLLNVGQLEEGKLLYKFSYISIVDLIRKIMKGFFEEAERKNIKMVLEEPEIPLSQVEVDEERMQLVLQNLLDNAIKYTVSGGQVTVSLKSDKMFLVIGVKDTGIGIPKDQQTKIFDKFFRASNAVKIRPEGSGLGLFIGKNIIEKHGGRLWFESEEKEGTTFYLTIPYLHNSTTEDK